MPTYHRITTRSTPRRSVTNPTAEPTDPQMELLHRLFVQVKSEDESLYLRWTAQLRTTGQWNRGGVSSIIDTLIARQRESRDTRPTSNPPHVHSAECRTIHADEIAEAVAAPVVLGVHLFGTDTIVRVVRQRARYGTPSQYARAHRLVVGSAGRGRWLFVGSFRLDGTTRQNVRLNVNGVRETVAFTEATLITRAQAETLSVARGFCVMCGRALYVDQSVERGIGPVCYRRVMAQEALAYMANVQRQARETNAATAAAAQAFDAHEASRIDWHAEHGPGEGTCRFVADHETGAPCALDDAHDGPCRFLLNPASGETTLAVAGTCSVCGDPACDSDSHAATAEDFANADAEARTRVMVAQAQAQLPHEMHRYIDATTRWGDVSEMVMHAMEAFGDAYGGAAVQSAMASAVAR